MEDSPSLKSRLFIHLILDLAINFSSTGFNIKYVSITTAFCSHDHVTGLELVAFECSRIFFKFKMPHFLLLHTFRISKKNFKKIFALIDFPISIGVNNLSKIFHQSKISSHRISQTSYLAQFRNESDFITGLSIFMNEQRLI